jgi:GTP-binding protein HflX
MININSNKKEKVFIVSLIYKNSKNNEHIESTEELKRLCETADIEVVDKIFQVLDKPLGATYLGKGKLIEIKNSVENLGVKTLIFNDNLTPSQAKNISDITKCNIVDRTELILDIFSKHAKSKQSKIQVELAMLQYNYSRLKNMWKHLSRIEGGIGFKGPGEKQIELDRRQIKKKITLLKNRLNKINKETLTKRKKRKNFLSIALVGYTNAGKSTIFNKLTNSDIYTADRLFATLDSTSRLLELNNGEKIAITDTIGFIKNLPPTLINSFHSTLMEVTDADLLLHVVDVSNNEIYGNIKAVNSILNNLKVDEKNILMVFNKIDNLDKLAAKFLIRRLEIDYPNSVFISAKNDENMDKLYNKIIYFTEKSSLNHKIEIPMELGKLISFIYDNSNVIKEELDVVNNELVIETKIRNDLIGNIEKQIEEYKILKKYK